MTFRSFTTARNAVNEEIRTWSNSFTTWAHVKKGVGKEEFEARQKTALWDTIFKIRWRASADTQPDEKMRISYEGELYDIVSIRELGRKEVFEIKASRILQT